jgi:PIN domain nuclease of toxin-antitoxin system
VARIVLDASALLALIHGEPGQEMVAEVMPEAAICSVNLSEVVAKLAERGVPAERAGAIAQSFGLDVVPLDARLAVEAGKLRPLTRSAGLSLGDRCCIATAQGLGVPVMTAESAWEPLAEPLALDIHNIRPRGH